MPPLPASSDPFDDDDIFTDPAALDAIAAIEERAIAAATQAPKKHGIHHTVAPPGSGPRARGGAAALRGKPPPPINTNPGVRGCGFGWEPGGKNDARLAAGQAVRDHSRVGVLDDDSPPDIVMNDKGMYGFGSADDEPIIDERTRPEIRQLVDGDLPKSAGTSSAPGSQARREAIFGALPPLPARAPMQRSTSSSSLAGPSNPPRFAPRTLARSVSTGSQSSVIRERLARPPPAGLPPIDSQGSQPNPSQGAASRRAIFELEEERRLRQATEAEVKALRARLAALEERGNSPPWKEERGESSAAVSELKQQLWAAQGQAATAKRNQETMEARLLAEIDKLKGGLNEAQTQMKAREQEAQQRIESMKTQAIFSNHAAIASASKARQQSQWTASQRAEGQTPFKVASPLRDKNMFTPAPLTRSTNAKTRPAPPRFDGLTNAFAATPVTSRKRQRTEAPSPTTTPRKSRAGTASPMVISPVQSHHRGPPSEHGMEESMDWQPDFHAVVQDARNPKAEELVHHILYHAAPLASDPEPQGPPQSTIVRLVSRKCTTLPQPLQGSQVSRSWEELCGELLRLCGAVTESYNEVCVKLMDVFVALLRGLARGFAASWNNIVSTIDLLRLVASTILFFPDLPSSNATAAATLAAHLAAFCKIELLPNGHMNTTAPPQDLDGSDLPGTLGPEQEALTWDGEVALEVLTAEFVDAIASVSEALCMGEGKSIWSTHLADIILVLGSSPKPFHNQRAWDLFVTASCVQDNFRALMFDPNGEDSLGDVPMIDLVSRSLISYKDSSVVPKEQQSRHIISVLSALFMLSQAHPDAVILMTEKSDLIPCLVLLIHRESSRVWGVRASGCNHHSPLQILAPAVTLLHHLVYPPPPATLQKDDLTFSTAPQGVDLARRLQEAGSKKEFNGVQHIFVSAFGALAFAEVDVEGSWAAISPTGETNTDDLRTIQFLAQDLLDAVVEGPEGDSVYAIYVEEEAPPLSEEEEDYGEEERLMGAEVWDSE